MAEGAKIAIAHRPHIIKEKYGQELAPLIFGTLALGLRSLDKSPYVVIGSL